MIFRELHVFVQDVISESFGEEGGKSVEVKARCLTLTATLYSSTRRTNATCNSIWLSSSG